MQAMTTAQEIRHRFLTLFTIFTLVLGLAVIGVVGIKLARQRQTESIELVKSLNRSIIDDKPDWEHWRRNSTINTQNTYVSVRAVNFKHRTETYYSTGTKKFLKAKAYHLPVFPAMWYVHGYGLMYFRSGSSHGTYSQIWLNMSPVTSVLKSVVWVLLIILLVGWLCGWYFISKSAQALTRPLKLITDAANKQAQNNQHAKADLPIPTQPLEVHDLASSFNQLLTAINAQNEQEKEFISNAAHELRTPIAAILGHARLVQRRGDEHPEIIPNSLKFITDEAGRMQALVNSLLTLSRADRGNLKLDYFDLTGIINETVEEARAVQKQTIRVKMPEQAIVRGNPESIQQILMALLENAGKYSPTTSEITVQVQATPKATVLSVIDTGPGIADSDKRRIFDRFYRVDAARDKAAGGTGLGLAIVAQLATLNQLKVDVTDAHPHGSQFNLYFPTPSIV